MHEQPQSPVACDVAIIGGSLAGAATAILLLQENPRLRIVVVEKSSRFTRRVGEATVEVSAFFLSRVLGLGDHLNHNQLLKQGMRFWFHNEETNRLTDCAEIGGRYLARIPSYQVDRSTLDEAALSKAQAMGAEVLRPGSVRKVKLAPGGLQVIEIALAERTQTLSARWVVDASGVAAVLARQEGWWRSNDAHPTCAAWARWTGVKDWDGLELARKYPDWARACHGLRGTATNHIVGRGWWAWCIPLRGGDMSIGVVFDERLVVWPKDGSLADRLKQFLSQHPVAREIMADAQAVEGDVHWRKHLPYYSATFAGDGFVLVGDAAGFIDPFYSPGMDWLAFTTTSAAALIQAQFAGADLPARIIRHNHDFAQSYARWFDALYRDKYQYMGDFDLMRLAFLLDLGLYYMGVVSQPFKRGAPAFQEPIFSTPPSTPFYHLIRTYNRRLACIAESRHVRNTWGKSNAHHRFLFKGYTLANSSILIILRALFGWGLLELREGWRTWFRRPPESVSATASDPPVGRLRPVRIDQVVDKVDD